ncbi:MAG TPA: cupin domain-containing protein [Bacteroidales bacterium]|nr:cupin domain-containing protein [Bacteroidales bacterium]
MKTIFSEKINIQEANKRGITSWPIWEKEASRFPASYDAKEECYILEGEFCIEAGNALFNFGPGDFVVFPADFECIWDIKKKVKKHYNFPL